MVESGRPGVVWSREGLCVFVQQPSGEHRLYYFLHFLFVGVCWVIDQLEVECGVLKLALSFTDVIFLAKYYHCIPFVRWLDNDVFSTTEVVEGLPLRLSEVIFRLAVLFLQ